MLENPKSKDRDKHLSDIRKAHGFSEYGIHKFVKSIQQKFKEHIGSFEAQKLATRAFQTVEKLHFGKSKKVHFKTFNDDISVENKSNTTGLRACSKRTTKRDEKFEERKTRGPERMVLIREDRRVRVTKKFDSYFSRTF